MGGGKNCWVRIEDYGTILLKIKYHICAAVGKAGYKLLFGKSLKLGPGVTFRKYFHVWIENGGRIAIGGRVFFNHGCSLSAREGIRIGSDCIFGENVKIYDHDHIYKEASLPIREQGYVSAPVIVGDNCWIGSNVTILKGVEIGNHAVIGAGCCVRTSVAAHQVVKGPYAG